ncbi:TetR/AcrR family transcriptional regulator [Liquorilactobacillus hordei]|uniref:TetR family transcriptional regulator n=1 Tax=Liquorilactobacillus hordei TaxID=468911 RepID=A0A3S6QPJ0_9LACO|nr:TetR/AcrR family transcriptional regulator [Liquorilactobacillus hordei]AUJ29896.1 TetR family transcriptional regulator [Liquorilactobacillus hordei]
MGQIERRFEIREIKKQDVLNAAESKFFKKGFAATSIDEIASEAEFSKKTLYTYFESKNQIYFEIMLRGYKKLLKLIQSQYQESHPLNSKQQFTAFWAAFEDFSVNCKGYLSAIIFFEVSENQIQESYKLVEYQQLKKELIDNLVELLSMENSSVNIKSKLLWRFILGAAQSMLHNSEESKLILQNSYQLLSSMVDAELS